MHDINIKISTHKAAPYKQMRHQEWKKQSNVSAGQMAVNTEWFYTVKFPVRKYSKCFHRLSGRTTQRDTQGCLAVREHVCCLSVFPWLKGMFPPPPPVSPPLPPSVSLPSPTPPPLPGHSLLSEFTTNNVQYVRLSWADSAGIKIWISKEALVGALRWEGEHQTEEEEEEEEGDGERGRVSDTVYLQCECVSVALKVKAPPRGWR